MSLDIYPLYILHEKAFERLVNHLLYFEYGIEIRFVDDRSGDKGLDAYVGIINGKLHAFQSKFFPKKIGPSQQDQIRSSLKTANSHHKLKSWTLCVPKDLDPAETSWLDGHVKRKYPKLKYDVLGLTKISALLNKHFHVAEAFFQEHCRKKTYYWRNNFENSLLFKRDLSNLGERKLYLKIRIVESMYLYELRFLLSLIQQKDDILNYYRNNHLQNILKDKKIEINIKFVAEDEGDLRFSILLILDKSKGMKRYWITENHNNSLISKDGSKILADYNEKL